MTTAPRLSSLILARMKRRPRANTGQAHSPKSGTRVEVGCWKARMALYQPRKRSTMIIVPNSRPGGEVSCYAFDKARNTAGALNA
jgi:hypothetical protein